jgi:hypothetical protein
MTVGRTKPAPTLIQVRALVTRVRCTSPGVDGVPILFFNLEAGWGGSVRRQWCPTICSVAAYSMCQEHVPTLRWSSRRRVLFFFLRVPFLGHGWDAVYEHPQRTMRLLFRDNRLFKSTLCRSCSRVSAPFMGVASDIVQFYSPSPFAHCPPPLLINRSASRPDVRAVPHSIVIASAGVLRSRVVLHPFFATPRAQRARRCHRSSSGIVYTHFLPASVMFATSPPTSARISTGLSGIAQCNSVCGPCSAVLMLSIKACEWASAHHAPCLLLQTSSPSFAGKC